MKSKLRRWSTVSLFLILFMLGIVPQVPAQNAAPELTASQVDLPSITEDLASASNSGILVSSLISGAATSERPSEIGIAVVERDAGNGTWEFYQDGIWYNFDRTAVPAESNALLLPPTTSVRFVPATNFNGTAAFTFRAWDQSSGTAFGVANTTTNGGSTAFSATTAQANISVSPVNDGPAFSATEDKGVLEFNGTNGYVSMPPLQISGDYTVEAWVFVNQHGSWSRIADFGNGSSSDNILTAFAATSNRLTMETYVGSTGLKLSQSTAFPTGVWKHIAAVNNGSGTGTLYIDGQQVASGDQQAPADIVRALNYLGKSNWGQDAYFNGKMREVRIWDIARSQAQIQENMDRSLSGTQPGLLVYYPFTDGSGTTLTDASGNDFHGTIHNGASWMVDAVPQTSIETSEDTEKAIIFRVKDEDAGTGNISLTLTASKGILLLKDDISGGLTATQITGNNSKSVTVSAPLAAINTTIEGGGLLYTPDLNYSGSDNLSVTVNDNGLTGSGGSKSASITYNITIRPVNDAPVITSNEGGATAEINVEENTTAITTVLATDAESDAIIYSISGGADADMFSIDNSTGELSFVAAPDYENPADADGNNVYAVVVKAMESGSGGLYGEQVISVTITDVLEDVTPPTVVISSTKSNPTSANPIPVTISFSEKITGLTAEDLQIGNGTVASLTGPGWTFFATVGDPSEDAGNELENPWGVALDADGKIYVADHSGHRVQVFNSDRTYAATIGTGTPGTGESEFNSPRGVAVGSDGKIYVADADNHRVQIFNADYTYAATLGTGTAGNTNNEFYSPYDISVDAAGRFYVADSGNHRVQIFNADFTHAATIGTTGVAGIENDELNGPNAISLDAEGKIYVVDANNNRVQIFNADHTYAATIGTTGVAGNGNDELHSPVGVAVDADGKIYVADADNHRVQIFEADYTFAATIGTGVPGAGNNELDYPTGVAADGMGRIYVVDNGNQRVQIFENSNTYVATITPAAEGLVTVDLAAGAVTDEAGNENTAATQFSITYTITVKPGNNAPVVKTAIPDQKAYTEQAYHFSIPAGSFADEDAGDALTYDAKLTNGNVLPAWLSFNAATQSFSGTPALADKGNLTIRVTATDNSSASVSDAFVLEVVDPNFVPTDIQLSATEVEENKPVGTLVGSFSTSDQDENDVHIYKLVQGEGSADNEFFYLDGDKLYTKANFDAEIKDAYTIRVQSADQNDGKFEKMFSIRVKDVVDARVYIPNLFSPNRDGSNDTFRVRANGVQQISFRIFNRMGEMVYETSDVQKATVSGWDGTYKGKEQPSGSYVWQMTGKFTDGTAVQFEGKNTGNVTLIR